MGGLRENIIMRLVIEIDIRSQRVRNVYSKKYQTSSLGNMLGAFYWQLPMGINDTGFRRVILENTLRRRKIK